jgi:antitoxin Phd
MKRGTQAKTRKSATRVPSPKMGSVLSYTASKAKNAFGLLLERATRGEPVAITKHGLKRAYLISADQYHALRHEPEQKLSRLRDEFDELFARMQTRKFRTGMAAAFHTSPEKLGKAAVAAARKRG